MTEVVIVSAARSAVGKRFGTLAHVHPTDTLGPVLMETLDRAGVTSSDVGQVVGGCIGKVGMQGMNVTRNAWLAHGGDEDVACSTVDSQCGSSQYAVNLAHALVASGEEDIVLACGVENLSRIPIGADWAAGEQAGFGAPLAESYYARREFLDQFAGAERMAVKYGITREASDEFGLVSQQKARVALDEARFADQIVPLEVPVPDAEGNANGKTVTFAVDEVPRETSLEKLAQLKPVAEGIHTAGSSSQIADGASAVLLMSADAAERLGATPLARIVTTTLAGCDPVLMLEGPIPATRKMLAKAGLTLDDIDHFEINEAFSTVVLAWASETGADLDRVNPNGGAIALGHPLGATGCFLMTKAVHELHRSDGARALISICCGVGLGTGTIIERV